MTEAEEAMPLVCACVSAMASVHAGSEAGALEDREGVWTVRNERTWTALAPACAPGCSTCLRTRLQHTCTSKASCNVRYAVCFAQVLVDKFLCSKARFPAW